MTQAPSDPMTPSPRVVAVTGAAGHIGNVLVRELLAGGYRVRALVHHKHPFSLEDLEVEECHGDILDLSFLHHALSGCDGVFHIAGIISVASDKASILNEVNVTGTKNVVQTCLDNGIKRLVYTGSIHAFADSPLDAFIDETVPFDPDHTIGDYGRSKARACREISGSVTNGLDAVIVCPTAVIGPYDFKPSKLGQFVLDMARAKPIAYIDGAYDFVDVRDVALGHILAYEKGKCGETYILSGEHVDISELMDFIMTASGVRPVRIKVPYLLAQAVSLFTPYYYAIKNIEPRFTRYSLHTLRSNSRISCEKGRCDLGYSPRPVNESVRDAILWFKEKGFL